MIDHLVVKLVLLSLSCEMFFDSSVLLELRKFPVGEC